jgi:hypothetical protein
MSGDIIFTISAAFRVKNESKVSEITYLFKNTSYNPLQEACPAFRKPPGLEKIFITGWFNTIMVQSGDTVLARESI